MVNPVFLIAITLGFAFIFPLFEKINPKLSRLAGILVFLTLVVIPLIWFINISNMDIPYIYSSTVGLPSNLTINLAVSYMEALVLLVVNGVGLFVYLQEAYSKESPWKGKQIILLSIVMLGANGLIITRDIFNIFVFMEISTISLFGLLSCSSDDRVFEGGFKYMLASGLSSVFYLIGIGFFYLVAGTLNLDALPDGINFTGGVLGVLWPLFLLSGVLIELKPAFANGWGMDTYEAADYSLGAIMSGIQATALIIVLTKIIPLIESNIIMPLLLVVGSITFIISHLQALGQSSFKKMLGYSSSAQIGLVLIVLGSGTNILLAIVLLLTHSVAKSGLFYTGKYFNECGSGRDKPLLVVLSSLFVIALLGLPPFPGFGAKWTLLQILGGKSDVFTIFIILLGSLLEGVYLFRWLGLKIKSDRDSGLVVSEVVPDDDAIPGYSSSDTIGVASQTGLAGLGGCIKVHFSSDSFSYHQLFPALMAVIMVVSGVVFNKGVGLTFRFLIPFSGILFFVVLDLFRVPTKFQVFLAIVASIILGFYVYPELNGFNTLFGFIFLFGIGVQFIAFFNRKGYSPGLMALTVGLLVSLISILTSKTNFQLFFSWEMMTLTSYFLVLRGDNAFAGGYRYILFSLASAFFILAGFSMLHGIFIGEYMSLPQNLLPVILIIIGIIIKFAGIGVHIWLPVSYAEAENDVSSIFSTVLSKVGVYMLFLGGLYFSKRVFKGVDTMYLLGWIGVLTSVAGSMMALFQEDIKYTLAYSSMGQVGYMILGFSIMSHLGWISSLYLVTTHMMFIGMLFLSVSGVIYRTGTRLMYQTGGLIKRMPLSFISALFAIIALSGVPPLSGFGAKWLMYSALLEKGWYLQAAMAMFASGVAFLYLFRLIHSIFLGQEKAIYLNVKEAPAPLLIPQYIFMICVMAISMFPNLLIKPLQTVIEPYFASTVRWEGYEVISALGYWNGNAVMYVTMGVFIIPLIWLLIVNRHVYKVKQFNIVYAAERPFKPETTHYAYNFFGHYQKALGFLVEPLISKFWNGTGILVNNLSGGLRRWNSGNPQGYVFQILLYVIFLSFLMGGTN